MSPERMRHTKRSDAGFTLLEMLIAVTLVAMMAVSLWAVFRIGVRAWARGTEFMDANQRHRTLLDMMQKQLASTFCVYRQQDPQLGILPTLYFRGSQNSLHFVSLSSLRFQESPGLTLVRYEVGSEPGGNLALVEKESRYLGRVPEQEEETSSNAIPLFTDLSSCVFQYLDGGEGDTLPEWVGEWDGEEKGKLPKAVSISMIFQDRGGNAGTRRIVVPLHADAGDFRMSFVSPPGRRRMVVQ